MKIRYMKADALNYFKDNLEKFYTNYFTESDNSWMIREYGSDPFETYKEVPDFALADPDTYAPGALELENCKRIYTALMFLTPSQAVDERLWAGLCNDLFYKYLRRRFKNYELHTQKRDLGEIRSRFFYKDNAQHSSAYSNPISKWWWIGYSTYDSNNDDHFERLDDFGPVDFSTKAMSVFGSYTFSSNKELLNGIIDVLKFLSDNKVRVYYRNDFRAAMKYLNAFGGGVLLDSLTREEVYSILLTKVLELVKYKNKNASFYQKDEDEEALDSLNEVEEDDTTPFEGEIKFAPEVEALLSVKEGDVVHAEYGNVVIVKRLSDNTELPPYLIPASKVEVERAKPDIIRELPGLKVDELFIHMGTEYIVQRILK